MPPTHARLATRVGAAVATGAVALGALLTPGPAGVGVRQAAAGAAVPATTVAASLAPAPAPAPAPVPAPGAATRAVTLAAAAVPSGPAPGAAPSVPSTPPAPVTTAAPPRPDCRAAVLVHGGGYFFGDPGALEMAFAAPLRAQGFDVRNVTYPMLPDWPDVAYDDEDPWYPRPDVDSTPPALRVVHDRAVAALVPVVADAIATGCRVTLLGVSAGGSIVADLAHRFPGVDHAVLVVGASLTPDRMGGAPLDIFYGTADETVLPGASEDTCERWRVAGGRCTLHPFSGQGHLSPDQVTAALAWVIERG